MKFGVVTFPGSNCDYDAYAAAKLIGEEVEFLWHQSTDLLDCDVVILPGGFAHGDYLRSGAIARFFTDHAVGGQIRVRRGTGDGDL